MMTVVESYQIDTVTRSNDSKATPRAMIQWMYQAGVINERMDSEIK